MDWASPRKHVSGYQGEFENLVAQAVRDIQGDTILGFHNRGAALPPVMWH